RIEAHADALLWGDDRLAWWAACGRSRRAATWRQVGWAVLVLLVLGATALGITRAVERRAARLAVLEQISRGAPEVAAAALWGALDGAAPGDREDLLEALGARENSLELFEVGLGGLPADRRGEAVLALGELALPLVHVEAPESPEPEPEPAAEAAGARKKTSGEAEAERGITYRLASLLWSVDHSVYPESALRDRGRDLRRRALAPLWQRRPPPDPESLAWVELPGGTYISGEGLEPEADPERPGEMLAPKPVTVSPFAMLAHETTGRDFRRLFPDHPGSRGDDELPAVRLNWFEAVVYAAWVGGPDAWTRLPTQAEWEYAVRAGCEVTYCVAGGEPAEIGDVAWYRGNSANAQGKNRRWPVMGKAANPSVLFDLFGNVWEWHMDWAGPYPPSADVDPLGPTRAEPRYRFFGGGGSFMGPEWLRPGVNGATAPERDGKTLGLRPVRLYD
ncbi:MAG: formylglycine-generating enzyme family protein, partial [Acidobacteriota bacterium]